MTFPRADDSNPNGIIRSSRGPHSGVVARPLGILRRGADTCSRRYTHRDIPPGSHGVFLSSTVQTDVGT